MLAQSGVFEQIAHHAHQRHRGRHFLAVGLNGKLRVACHWWHRQADRWIDPARHQAAQGGTAGVQMLHRRAVGSGLVKLQIFNLRIRQRQMKTIAEIEQVLLLEFFLLMGCHLALASGAHAKAFFGLRENHRRRTAMVDRCVVRRVNFAQVMAAAFQAVDFVVGQGGANGLHARTLPKKMFAVEWAVIGRKGLQLTINGAVERIDEFAGRIARKQRIPIRAPQELDDVPASAGKQRLELVNDMTIAAHRAIQSLQVAVNDEDQIVEFFARRQRQGCQ